MAIHVYDVHCDDFSGNGRTTLLPTAASVTERAGGMYELEVTCPASNDQKYLHLAVGRVLKAPVPARTTPALELNHVTESATTQVWKVKDGVWSWRVVRAGPGQYSAILDRLQVGEEVIVTGPPVGGDWKPATSPRGISGYVAGPYLEFVRDVSEASGGWTEVIPPKPVKEQLFRIYEVDAAEDGLSVTAKARHISYDLLYNVILDYKTDAPTKVANVCAGLFTHLADTSAPWRCFCDVETAAPATDYRNRNPIDALLDEGNGVVPRTRSMVLRDNYDFYVTALEGTWRGVTIRHGKNLLGATLTTSDDGVYTRILPYGEDRDGNPLYLEGTRWIDSPAIVNYPAPRIQALKVQGAKVGAKDENGNEMDAAAVRAKLAQEAQRQLGTGVDHTKVKLSVSFVDLGGTEEYTQYAALQQLHLYDMARVVHPPRSIDTTAMVIRYKWNLITGMCDEIDLGDPFASQLETLAGSQLASGSVTGVQLRDGSVGAGQIESGAVTGGKLAAGAITTDKLAAGAIEADTISAGAITSDKIAAGAVEADKLAAGAITSDKIAAGTISSEQINVTELFTSENAKIGWAQIIGLTADTALFVETATGKLSAADLAVTNANIVDLNAGKINTGTLSVERLVIVGREDSIVYEINSANGTLQLSKTTIDGGAITHKTITADQIVAQGVTAACLNVEEIFASEAMAGRITARNIDVKELFASEATAGVIHTGHLAADVGGSLDISANQSINILAGRVSGVEQDQKDFASYFRFDADGLRIGKRGAKVELLLRNDRMAFLDEQGQEVAYLSSGKLYVSQSEITQSMKIGNYSWRALEDGSVGLLYEA